MSEWTTVTKKKYTRRPLSPGEKQQYKASDDYHDMRPGASSKPKKKTTKQTRAVSTEVTKKCKFSRDPSAHHCRHGWYQQAKEIEC